MQKPIFYTSAGLDRADGLRADPEWLEQRMRDPKACVLPVWRNRNLIVNGARRPTLQALSGTAAKPFLEDPSKVVLLGLAEDIAYFAVDLSEMDEDAALHLAGSAAFIELRHSAALMPHEEGSMLAYARGMLHWHKRHRFCGDCGHPTVSTEAGHVRRCTNPDCGTSHFPRTDPAVIMLVTRSGPDGGACLLGHKDLFPTRMYSTLAGFVEPGESLEEAVAREVMEETGVAVTDVRYRASQPWPFPASLMLGFRAEATSFDITVCEEELADARWFSRGEVLAMGRFNDEDAAQRLPRDDSIALWLIEEWLAEGA